VCSWFDKLTTSGDSHREIRVYSRHTMAVRIDPEQHEPAALNSIGVDFTNANILEVGAGDGRLTKTFARLARSVIAIDPDPSVAREFLDADAWPPHVEFQPVGIDAYQPGHRRFDIVLFSWSL
jgi:2-polyprenyl-3-methyl-5-hydroxy-6-metoxy-1,4-benzoquinol methylase